MYNIYKLSNNVQCNFYALPVSEHIGIISCKVRLAKENVKNEDVENTILFLKGLSE